MRREDGRPGVRAMTGDDLAGVVATLVRSFADDPLVAYFFTGQRRRDRGLHSFFTSQIRHQYLPGGHVEVSGRHDGVAVWGAPDRKRNGFLELLQLAPTSPFLAGSHLLGSLRLVFDIDARHPKEPHWYLATLGVDPDLQGKGIGSALLASQLARIDEEGTPAYLESSKERNVPLYARFGFEVVEELRLGSAPPVWRMWREPRAPEL